MSGRRLLVLFLVLGAIGLPAGVLRAACAGRSCHSDSHGTVRIPFCALPDNLKTEIAAGYREGRSPDVLAVTTSATLWGGTDDRSGLAAAWPSVSGGPSTLVPIVFWGTGVSKAARLPSVVGLDQIAPTLSTIIGFRRPHPDVRAGRPLRGVGDGARPRLVVEIAWTGIGSGQLRHTPGAWPYLRTMMRTGVGTLDGDTGSLPLDPAATLTTIGTGGLPFQHGITGTLLRNDKGRLVRAWGPHSPLSVIATLADDLDQAMKQRPKIGLVAPNTADRGIIGGNWYLKHDRDAVVIARGRGAVHAARRMLATGFGHDEIPDILAVVLEGTIRSMDARTRAIVSAAVRASGGSLVVAVAGTGEARPAARSQEAAISRLVSDVDSAAAHGARLVSGVVPGGLFLDQRELAKLGVSGDAAVQALMQVTDGRGRRIMDDSFQGFAVSFARYC